MNIKSSEIKKITINEDGSVEILTIPGVSRYESNGIIASLISISKKALKCEDVTKEIAEFEEEHMGYYDALNSIVYTAWDVITIEEYFEAKSSTPYNFRFQMLKELILDGFQLTNVKLVEYKVVNSYEEAMAHFQEMLNRGEEGTILKSFMGAWKDGKPNWVVKVKKEVALDLKIVGFNYGTGKNADVISSINVESEDGLLKTSPTGISEKEMRYITDNQENLLGTIVEVKCSGLSHDKLGNYALLHPVYKGSRVGEKTVANTFEECLEIDKSALLLS